MRTRLSFTFSRDDTYEHDAIIAAVKMRSAYESLLEALRSEIKYGKSPYTRWETARQLVIDKFEEATRGFE